VSDASDSAIVRLFLADHVVADASQKLNILGGNVQIITWDVRTGMSSPFALLVIITFDHDQARETPAVEVVLENEAGDPVALPSLAPGGDPQYVRMGSAAPVEEPSFRGIYVPRRIIKPRQQIVMAFPNGLPLAVGQAYIWRVRIDQETRDDWTETFYVPGPHPGTVVG